jgi:hypothetical protein
MWQLLLKEDDIRLRGVPCRLPSGAFARFVGGDFGRTRRANG